MAREIIDGIVVKNIASSGDGSLLGKLRQQYGGEISLGGEKVKLESSVGGFSTITALSSLREKLDSVKAEDGKCYIRVKEMQMPIGQEQLKMLKALASEQVSKSKVYSRIVSSIYLQLICQVMQGEKVYLFTVREGEDRLGQAIFHEVTKFILDKFGQKEQAVIEAQAD